MNRLNYYGFINKLTRILISILLFFTLLASLYVCCYLFSEKVKIIIFVILILLFLLLLIFFKKRIQLGLALLLNKISKLTKKQMFLIITILMVVLKILYSLIFYFDPTTTNDVSSRFIELVNLFLNDGILSNTVGDRYYFLTLHLSLFKFLHIPYHIGLFIILSGSILLMFNTFYNINKEKAFLLLILYIFMPSTMLLTFCPSHELFLMFYLSLFIFSIYTIFESSSILKKVLYTLLILISIFMCKCFSYVGSILMIIIFITLLLTKYNNKVILTIILVFAISITNIYSYAFSYSWRNKELMYHSLLYGTSIESKGTFIEGYPKSIIEGIKNDNKDINIHDLQEEKYKNELDSNINKLLNNPTDLIKTLSNKFYILFSGNHYSIEMLKNNRNINDILYYVLLGINEIIYIFFIFIGLINNDKNEESYITFIEIIVILISIMLLINEALNRYALYITPFVFMICLSRVKRIEK